VGARVESLNARNPFRAGPNRVVPKIDSSRSSPKYTTHGLFDQLYTDEKFEAYRALVHFMASRSVAAMYGQYDQSTKS
jgi:hypothetical protein